MLYELAFFIELLGLFFLSQAFSKLISRILLLATNSQHLTIHVLSALLLPGVIVHELSHWFMASILFVQTGEMEFWPQIQGNVVKMGSVMVAKTDPFRRLLIGVAPILIGLTVMVTAFFYLSPFFPQFNWQTMILLFIFFELGNTMFSSKKDLEGTLAFVIALVVIGAILYFFGLRIPSSFINFFYSAGVTDFFQKLDEILLVPISINMILLIIPRLFLKK